MFMRCAEGYCETCYGPEHGETLGAKKQVKKC